MAAVVNPVIPLVWVHAGCIESGRRAARTPSTPLAPTTLTPATAEATWAETGTESRADTEDSSEAQTEVGAHGRAPISRSLINCSLLR